MSEQSDMRNSFGKRNAETDQDTSSSGCSESVESRSSQKPALKKDRKFQSIFRSIQMVEKRKWLDVLRHLSDS